MYFKSYEEFAKNLQKINDNIVNTTQHDLKVYSSFIGCNIDMKVNCHDLSDTL